MKGRGRKNTAASVATKRKSRAPMELRVALVGDQRLTENVIVEVRSVARRYGLEIPSIRIVRKPPIRPKDGSLRSRPVKRSQKFTDLT
jgi:hypothetical protein